MTVPHHIAAVPNGNRRRSKEKGISLEESYVDGATRALELAEWSREAGVKHITFFGLSCENLKNRSSEEIDSLQEGAVWFCDHLLELDFRVHVFGKIDEFADNPKYRPLFERLKKLNERKRQGDFVVHIAANYSGRVEHELSVFMDELYARGFEEVRADPSKFLLSGGVPDVDLFIRTGGESRLSGLLPFQTAYAEIKIVDALWGDFDRCMFRECLDWYTRQQRNFGK